jgi:hypothetical protein
MAAENCLWGAPRIRGELLKLGFTISERRVSRYLHGRPTNRSQTWRTSLANTFGNRASISPVMFADADDEEIRDPLTRCDAARLSRPLYRVRPLMDQPQIRHTRAGDRHSG